MTRKEIIDGLKFTVDMFLFNPSTGETFTEPRNDMDKTTIDACKGAIKLLEQTDGDLISRQDAEGIFREARRQLKPQDYKTAYEFNTRDLILLNAEQLIHQLPPVTPQLSAEKTAEWIDNKDVIEITQEIQHHYMCSKCGMYFDRMTNYCPNCGARMKEGDTE